MAQGTGKKKKNTESKFGKPCFNLRASANFWSRMQHRIYSGEKHGCCNSNHKAMASRTRPPNTFNQLSQLTCGCCTYCQFPFHRAYQP